MLQTGTAAWRELAAWAADGRRLLRGARAPALTRLSPRAPMDNSTDWYSERSAVFVKGDRAGAVAYEVRAPECPQFYNACFHRDVEVGLPSGDACSAARACLTKSPGAGWHP